MNNNFNQPLNWLWLILVLAAIFRFFSLGQADVIGDESTYSFRALGYLDYFAETQSTPISWFVSPPWWTKFSFHDHPPLNFLLNFLVLNFFGPTAWAIRIVSALAGVISVWLIYLIGKKIFNEQIGLIAALILAVNNFMVWLSRIGLQESLLISLILASFYFFILALEKQKFLSLAFLFFGLSFLTKYTAIFILPIYLLVIIFKKREWLKSQQFYLSVLLFFLIISPIIIYNFFLWQSRTHFDLQLSYLFGLTDKVPGWQELPGKSDLPIWQRFIQLPISFIFYLSPLFLIFLIFSLVYAVSQFKKTSANFKLIWLGLLFLVLLIGLVGPENRFLVMFTPFFILFLSYFWHEISIKSKLFNFLLIIFIALEIFYTVNTFFVLKPISPAPIFYSYDLRQSRGNFGFNQLNQYLNDALAGKSPAVRFQLNNAYLEKRVSNYLDKQTGQDAKILLIFDHNIKDGPDVWYLWRWQFYEGWPVVTADQFLSELKNNGQNYYLDAGFNNFYFIQPTELILWRQADKQTQAGAILGQSLLKSGIQPKEIQNSAGQTSFLVYQF
ncbi:MAG TPA: glycosyltransferase family 39 protein [Patescibacteria group bacterium]|nr:glycosyltransferase family 39 protein [Patescibacteria group bacterium]